MLNRLPRWTIGQADHGQAAAGRAATETLTHEDNRQDALPFGQAVTPKSGSHRTLLDRYPDHLISRAEGEKDFEQEKESSKLAEENIGQKD
ncbi:hypothetical protein DEO72_LG7g2456 [Vigna unguiculata]|uniref:Uncharacterized protein n=1 Tax=Vigna unguiculata TaxID=3917 RepID=A0A4D6MIC7_VIGUN|nr:hypothetical protein DEO72_LG7g2456 [Vigna unguiculata]